MKLNNKGWGLTIFLLFILMFFGFLMIIAYLVNQLNNRFIVPVEDNYVYVEEIYY